MSHNTPTASPLTSPLTSPPPVTVTELAALHALSEAQRNLSDARCFVLGCRPVVEWADEDLSDMAVWEAGHAAGIRTVLSLLTKTDVPVRRVILAEFISVAEAMNERAADIRDEFELLSAADDEDWNGVEWDVDWEDDWDNDWDDQDTDDTGSVADADVTDQS